MESDGINSDEIFVTIQEMCIVPVTLTIQEAMTLMEHSLYASSVRKRSGKPLHVSRKSGHRPVNYERSRGRTGGSQHSTFDTPGRGAVDYIYDKDQFDIMMSESFYTRICYYPNNGFYHCDRKPTKDGRLEYFEAQSPASKWKFIKTR